MYANKEERIIGFFISNSDGKIIYSTYTNFFIYYLKTFRWRWFIL